MIEDLTEFVSSLRRFRSRRQLGQTLLDYYRSEGVQMATYHGYYSDGVPREPAIDGFPKEWANRYVKEHLETVDPFLAQAARQLLPVRWSDVAKHDTLSKANRVFLEESSKVVKGDGVSFKVFGPNLRNAYVALGFGPGGVVPDDETVLKFQWVAQAGHLRFCELSDAAAPDGEALTGRELEVLSWVAHGKSNSVIADLMAISPHTVDSHVRSIYKKLRVTDRTSAALTAQRQGLLGLSTWSSPNVTT